MITIYLIAKLALPSLSLLYTLFEIFHQYIVIAIFISTPSSLELDIQVYIKMKP